jgi:hypothetical protein
MKTAHLKQIEQMEVVQQLTFCQIYLTFFVERRTFGTATTSTGDAGIGGSVESSSKRI